MRVIDLGKRTKASRITVLSYGGMRTGKCVTGDTRILNPDGRYERIDEIVRWGKYHVLALDEGGVGPVVASTPSDYHDMGISRIYELGLADGRLLRGTPEHPVLTADRGYVPLSRLSTDDAVVVCDDLPFFGAVTPPEHVPELLAYLIADGNLTQGSPTISKLDDGVRARIIELVRLYGDNCLERFDLKQQRTPRVDISGGAIKEWLADSGLWGRGSTDKFIPDEVFTWTKLALTKFLSTLFSCDGTLNSTPVEGRRSLNHNLSYSSSSPRMIREIAHLLRRFGFRPRVRYVKGMLEGVEHGGYDLLIHPLLHMARFIREIGIARPRAMEIAEDCEERATKTPVRDRGALSNGLRAELVKYVEPAGEARVYDLTIPGLHNFIANDIVVHNTRFAASWPRPLFLSDATESGWTTIENMDKNALYEPERLPIVWAIERAQDMMAAIKDIETLIKTKPGHIQTVVVDSLTFYADLFFNTIDAAGGGRIDNRQLYQRLAQHLRNLREQIHLLPLNVIWLALAKDPGEDNPIGQPMLSGQNAAKFAAGCDYVLYHRSFQPTPTAQLQWEIRTRKWQNYAAGGRDEGLLPDPLAYIAQDEQGADVYVPDCSYRTMAEALGIVLPETASVAAPPPTAPSPTSLPGNGKGKAPRPPSPPTTAQPGRANPSR